jgi:hypothetical protein
MNLKGAVPILVVAISAGFLGGMVFNLHSVLAEPGPQTIRAQQFELLDATGKVRVKLASNPQSGASGIFIFDPSNASPRIFMGISADGGTNIQLMDGDGKRRASFDLLAQGSARLSLVNSDFKGGAVLATSDNSQLVFSDDNQKPRLILGVAKSSDPAVVFYDENKNLIWSAPPSK